MASTHVLHIRRTDEPSAHLLVHVTQTSRTRPLDLKLVATEHEHLYHGSVKSNNLVALQASKYNGSDDEWKAIVTDALLQQRSEANLDALRGLETVAAISGETCTLILRKNIGGVTKRVGAIELQQDDEREEVNAFQWVDTAAASADLLREELVANKASETSLQARVDKLTTQLDELVKAKKEHEEQLLRKAAVLLNSKKAETRNKQRELNAVAKGQSYSAGTSSRGKRKANGPALEDEEDEEAAAVPSDEDADDDDLDAEEEEGQRTPEQETEDEGSDDEGFAAPPAAAPSTKATKATAPPARSSNRKRGVTPAGEGAGSGDGQMDVDVEDLPPRRELPFARNRSRADASQAQEKTRVPAPAPVQDEDDTDDEL